MNFDTRPHPEATMYLADRRICTQTAAFQRRSTLGAGPFGTLRQLTETTLQPAAPFNLPPDAAVLLLPVAGGLEYACGAETGFLEPGQAGWFSPPPGATLTVLNPYETAAIHLLHLERAFRSDAEAPGLAVFSFDLTRKNALLPLGEPSLGYIGRYGGREEGTYRVLPRPGDPAGRVFVFVLNGVFEVANRLLHEGDGLALTYAGAGEVDFEALSNEALLLLFDC
jgi:hypothetical protein